MTPNLNKEMPKLYIFQFCARNGYIFCMYDRVFGNGEFKYAIRIFQGANGVATATKFRHKT